MTSTLLASWWLGAARIFALLRAQAAPRAAFGPVWLGVSAALGLLLAPIGAAPVAGAELSGVGLLALIGLELLLGTVLGAAVSLGGHALIGGAQVSATALRLGQERGAFVAMILCLSLGLGLALGLHRPALAALVDLRAAWPPGRPELWLDPAHLDLDRIVSAARGATVLALALASPVLLVALVLDLVAGLASGAGVGAAAGPATPPAVDVAAWLRLALCLLALSAAWLSFPQVWGAAWTRPPIDASPANLTP